MCLDAVIDLRLNSRNLRRVRRPSPGLRSTRSGLVPLAPAPAIDVVWEDGEVVRLRAEGRELVRER